MPDTVSPLELQVVVSPPVDLSIGGTFSPTTATIITGPTEAVVVDTLYTPADVDRLAEAIEATGKTLTTIYITHAHFDHYVGLGVLLERFPSARGVALPSVANAVREVYEADRELAAYWLPGNTVDTTVFPDALDGETIALDGHELRAIEIGQGDVGHSSVLHVPSLDAVIAGDLLYNGVHQMLGVSGPDDWPRWIDSVDKIAALNPKILVAGHKADLPDDDVPAILDGTRGYIAAFIEELAQADDAPTLIARMTARFPDHINPATLGFSAAAAIELKLAAGAPESATQRLG